MLNKLFSKKVGFVKLSVIILVSTFHYTIETNGAALRAGISKVNITKDNPAVLVNDPLFARVLVFDDGKTNAFIIDIRSLQTLLRATNRERSHLI